MTGFNAPPGPPRRRRAEQWLDRIGIAEFAGRNITQLSGAQRQRVALARSLVVNGCPFLDAVVKVRMQSVLKTHHRETGITFVYVTHSQSEALSMADRVVIMSRGKIEQIGTPQDIHRAPRTRFVADFLGSSNLFQGVVVRDTHGRPCHRHQQRGFRPAGPGGGRGQSRHEASADPARGRQRLPQTAAYGIIYADRLAPVWLPPPAFPKRTDKTPARNARLAAGGSARLRQPSCGAS